MLKPLAATLLLAGPAFASSDDAWAEFAAEVESACLAAAGDTLSDASAVVDPFGSESYGLAIVSGRTANDAPASMICVLNKQSRAVEIGGELAIRVSDRGPEPLTAEDTDKAALTGELFCSFEAEARTLLFAAGNVASDQPAEAAVKLSGQPVKLSVDGGFDAITRGALFTGHAATAEVAVTGEATEDGESPAYPATLTVRPEEGPEMAAEGLWRCGP
ncbi:hypothetical protein GQY15_14535 [Rhodobacter sphaeroides]|uniref:hypothetical protein n=1 Tax=Cereibacter sphaeroides TaxID=1063 RepID=UPI00132C6F81|nr:hypothetical protein [Cereibacter sphaeroides]MWP38792.1 hypothetical protein [Cereibacter sphaeroides]